MNLVKKLTIFGTVTIASLAIAHSASARFVVFVTGNDAGTLQRVRMVSPSAFATKINDQPVIQAGMFDSESSADSLAIALQQSGLTAQKYFRSSGGKETNVQVPFTDTTTSTSVSTAPAPLPSPQQVVIQPSSVVQPTTFQVESQPQIFNSVPQQAIAYNQNQYQQITTNTVVPQVQTQQVLVPRWQQVLVPETRQFVTQTVVPQTQIIQTGNIQTGNIQTGNIQSGYVQSAYIQPNVQATGYTQAIGYTQPQTSFVPTSSTVVVPNTYDNSAVTATSFAVQPQPTASAYTTSTSLVQQPQLTSTAYSTGYNTAAYSTGSGYSNEPLIPQATQNPNFRYVAAVPSSANNQFLLSRVRQYVPSAFLSSSGRGTYIHAGAYQNRDSAEAVSRYLRSQGVDSRVLYF